MTGKLPEAELDTLIDIALAEDAGHGDVTSEVLIPPRLVGRAIILVKKRGIVAGAEVARRVCLHVDPSLRVNLAIRDGSTVKRGDIVGTISGSVAGILKAERVALNFMQRLSGIASLTARYVARARGFKAVIVDTRKTTPGLRLLEKYAVRMGGGKNHRLHLGDAILIKDNHIAALRARGLTLAEMVARAKSGAPAGIIVEIEVTTPREAGEAVGAGADMILLDNMSTDAMRQSVEMIAGRARVEASGGITLANVREVASTGVDIISIGALTHSARALDISIEIEPESVRLL